MSFNAGIILQGRQPDMLNTLARATQTAGMANQVGQQNALRSLYREQGPGIAAGEQGALNALSRLDPNASLGVQQAQLGMENTRHQMSARDQQLQLARASAGRAAQAHAARMTALERQQALEVEAQRDRDLVSRAAMLAQRGDIPGANALLASGELGQIQSAEDIPFIAVGIEGAIEGLAQAHKMLPQEPSKTTAIQNFEYGQKNPAFVEAQLAQRRAGATQVDLRDQPGLPEGVISVDLDEGTMAVQNPNAEGGISIQTIPGGKADLAAQKADREAQQFAADQANTASAAVKADEIKTTAATLVLDEISIARELIEGQSLSSPATGLLGKAASTIDSTRAGALKNRLTTIKSNIGFDKLQSMRDASPTGGALGQVSEFENRLLQAVFGSLEQAQKAEDILYNLGRLEGIYNRVIHEGIPDEEARQLYREVVTASVQGTETVPDGIDAEDWQFMTPEERALWN